MTLAGKWGIFRRKMGLHELEMEQQLAAQGCFLAGAQAAFQILGAASTKTKEEAIVIWGEFQQELLQAVRPKDQPLVEIPPEKRIVI